MTAPWPALTCRHCGWLSHLASVAQAKNQQTAAMSKWLLDSRLALRCWSKACNRVVLCWQGELAVRAFGRARTPASSTTGRHTIAAAYQQPHRTHIVHLHWLQWPLLSAVSRMVPASEGGVLWPHYHCCDCRVEGCKRHRPYGCKEYYESMGYTNARSESLHLLLQQMAMSSVLHCTWSQPCWSWAFMCAGFFGQHVVLVLCAIWHALVHACCAALCCAALC